MEIETLIQKLSESQELSNILKESAPTSQPSLNSKVKASRIIWQRLARKEQLPPEGDWKVWLYLAGRGAGKTRTAAEWLAWEAIEKPGTRWAIVAPTFTDVRDTCAEGESGIINILRRYQMLKTYNRSMGEIELINDSRIKLFSADEPDRFRGPQHHGAWCDELAAYRYEDSWHQLQFGLRLGENPQVVVTTTPRPVSLVRSLANRTDGSVAITRGSTFDNAANLSKTALAELQARYEGTRTGRQELYGEILDDMEGALWTRNWIEQARITKEQLPPLYRIVVAIDPAVTSGENSDETGIVVAGASSTGHFYVLEDATMRSTPDAWGKRAVQAFRDWKADRIVAEVNNGGDMVIMVLRSVDNNVPVTKVHATRGKKVRAEPISALYEQGRVHHVGGFNSLEDQMVTWTPESDNSPDRLDALVWALTELKDGSVALAGLQALAVICTSCQMPNKKTNKICEYCTQPL